MRGCCCLVLPVAGGAQCADRRLLRLYRSNFAATGNPNTPPSRNTHLRVGDFPTWPMVGDNEGELKFMTPANVVETAPFKQTCALWDAIGKYPFP